MGRVVIWWNADSSATHFQVFIHPTEKVPVGGMRDTSAHFAGIAAANGSYRAYAVLQIVAVGEPYYYAVRGGPSSDPTDGSWGEWSPVSFHDGTFMGDGHVRPVEGDSPAEAIAYVRDYGTENAPIFIAVIGAIFAVGTTFWLVRRGLARSRGAMRL